MSGDTMNANCSLLPEGYHLIRTKTGFTSLFPSLRHNNTVPTVESYFFNNQREATYIRYS